MARYSATYVEIFQDTMRRCPEVPVTEFIKEDFTIEPAPGTCKVTITNADTLSACSPGDIALNFASGWTPGGGVLKGTTAQEENICQRSQLYRSLTCEAAKPFYADNRRMPNISTNAMLLSRDVKVIKDANFNLLAEPFDIDVLTVAAPRLTDGMPCSQQELDIVLKSRIYAIVKTLIAKGYRRAILGAWGCGAYRNDPVVIARLFHQALDKYAGYFDEVIFAIPIGKNPRNFDVFSREFICDDKPDFVFFWSENSQNTGCYSQWYMRDFEVDCHRYCCMEQYMMAQKAVLFKDMDALVKILSSRDPRDIKTFGREVKNFDEAVWNAHKYDIVYRGNLAKFEQNEDLKAQLLATGDKILAKASPSDTIWGIGLRATDPRALDPEQWLGQNLLGKALMQVRETLKEL